MNFSIYMYKNAVCESIADNLPLEKSVHAAEVSDGGDGAQRSKSINF